MNRSIPYLRHALWKFSNVRIPNYNSVTSSFRFNRTLTLIDSNKLKNPSNKESQTLCYIKHEHIVCSQRAYSKKKKSKKAIEEEEEESDADEDESFETLEDDIMGDNFNIVSKSVPSMRIDTVAKAAFGMTKKKVEKEYYANNLRLNGIAVLKKAVNISVEDEVDIVKGFSPENPNFLLVDRVIVKAIGKITSNGNYPVKFQVFKGLTIENYPDPWVKSSPNDPD